MARTRSGFINSNGNRNQQPQPQVIERALEVAAAPELIMMEGVQAIIRAMMAG